MIFLEKVRNKLNKIAKLKDIGNSLYIKTLFYNEKMIINGNEHILKDHTTFILDGNSESIEFKLIKTNGSVEYYTIELSNGPLIHYDVYGKAYQSLKPTSVLFQRRLPLYDIKNIL